MKIISTVFLSFALIGTAQAANPFMCSNAPAVRWGTYYCISGSYDSDGNLSEVEYGTCQGSDDAGEAEPVEIISLNSIKPDASLKATSREWKDANSYDVTTEEFGSAILYMQPDELKKEGDGVARLKLMSGSQAKNVNLRCYFN